MVIKYQYWNLFKYFYSIKILLSISTIGLGTSFYNLLVPLHYKYINNINKTNQMTADVQVISIIINKLSLLN